MSDKIIAIDLGGTNLRAGLVQNHKILEYIKKDTPMKKNILLKELFHSINYLMSKDVRAIGMACPGPLENGIIRNPPNIPLKNFNLKKELKNRFKVRVEIEKDSSCVALAELRLGCSKRNFIILTLGTGIGGGIVINGELYKGQGYAGELGYMILNNGKTFEDLWKESKEKIKNSFGKKLLIKDLIEINNKKSKKILNEISLFFGQGIASIINVFDPEVVILSGGMKETGNIFLNMIQNHAKEYILLPKKTPIKWTSLEHPGILGASLLIS